MSHSASKYSVVSVIIATEAVGVLGEDLALVYASIVCFTAVTSAGSSTLGAQADANASARTSTSEASLLHGMDLSWGPACRNMWESDTAYACAPAADNDILT